MTLPTSSINWLVGRLHVSTPDAEVKAEIRKRCTAPAWTEDLIKQAEKYAVRSHRRNQKLYQAVVSGRL